MLGMKKGCIQITNSEIDEAGVHEGDDILVFKQIAILLSGSTFFIDILNEITHNCYGYV